MVMTFNKLIDEEAEILGRDSPVPIHIFSPDIVVMGGGLSNEFERSPTWNSTVHQQWAMPGFKDIEVVRADLVQNSGLIGLCCCAGLSRRIKTVRIHLQTHTPRT